MLLLCCAHSWEARPFIEALELKRQDRPHSPYQEYQAPGVTLILSGSGSFAAGQATAAILARLFSEHGWKSGAGLLAPSILVANFGTAGAQEWRPGQTLMVHRILDPTGQLSIYPERHLRSAWSEAECQTLLQPAVSPDSLRKRLVDMEAYGVATACTSYLSTSHLLVGKFVLDHPQPDPDWRELTRQQAEPYTQAAREFLDFAGQHLEFLQRDPRRQKALQADQWSRQCLATLEQKFSFSLTQRRQLRQNLRAAATSFDGETEFQRAEAQLQDLLSQSEGGTKHANRLIVQQLQTLLAPAL